MDYEHKDALDRARNLHKDAIDMGAKDVIKICEIIFPELAESEDERIRKWLIDTIKAVPNDSIEWEKIDKSDILAWLEKQGKETSWKPSKEEMDVLYGLAYITNQYDEHKEEVITRLYQDLKREFFNGSSYENMFSDMEDDVRRRSTIQILEYARSLDTYNQFGKADIDKNIAWLEKQVEPIDKGEISDGYHTFNELYYYRMLYNAAFFNLLPKEWVHKSKRHHDGEECFGGGWFIVMANLPTGQISNHYELKDWELFQIPEKEVADEWDGHTPQKAAERLHEYLLEKQGEKISVVDFKAEDWYVSKVDGKIYNAKYMEQNSCKKTTRREEIEKAAFSTTGIIEQTDWFIKGAEWADEHPCCNQLEEQGQVKESSILQHEDAPEGTSCKENDNSLTREQNPTWSEEDERFLNQVIENVDYALNDKDLFYEGTSPIINWLKSLQQRLGK